MNSATHLSRPCTGLIGRRSKGSPSRSDDTLRVTDLSITEAATLLGLHPNSVRALADGGELPHRRTAGGHRRFTEEDLHAYRLHGRQQPPAAATRAAVWAAAALAVLRDAEVDLGPRSALSEPFRAAAEELKRQQPSSSEN